MQMMNRMAESHLKTQIAEDLKKIRKEKVKS
jgi:hypothetical protein